MLVEHGVQPSVIILLSLFSTPHGESWGTETGHRWFGEESDIGHVPQRAVSCRVPLQLTTAGGEGLELWPAEAEGRCWVGPPPKEQQFCKKHEVNGATKLSSLHVKVLYT